MLQRRGCYAKLSCIPHCHLADQTINEAAGKRIATTYPIYNADVILFCMIEFVPVIHQSTPTIVGSAVAFPERRSNIFKAKFFLHLLEHIFVAVQIQFALSYVSTFADKS